MNIYNIINKTRIFFNYHKKLITNVCFGILLSINMIAVPMCLQKLIYTMGREGWKNIHPLSSNWYERSKEAMIYFEQQNINLTIACCIMASLLYSKHKILAFICLFIPTSYIIIQLFT